MPACASCGHENSEGAKFCEECGFSLAAAPAGAKEQRKTVTVLFCDLAGSTSLGETVDPERLRALLARYFEVMKAIVERHGGSVEKFIGDAVMAVFGVPVLHEDDALRALRAAAEMRDALPELGLQGRIGVMTGEVVTGTEERLATGDAVNVAARLEQAAEPGEVLIGAPTLALARDAADVERVEPLVVKGKAEPVPAYRLLSVRDAAERSHRARFVGRERELALVGEVWDRVSAEQCCELVTVVGDAGVGKSRLVAELLSPIEATIVRGRCLPYGEGITYWPVVEVLKQLDLLPSDEAANVAIRSLLGETEAAASAEEIAWAFRKTLEQASAERPLVVVFDDIQWGEETFLDLIEHVALLSSGAAILLLCIARPELVEHRPAWPVTLRLEPLADDDVEELIPERIVGELRARITRAAGGNPLFIEEMLAMAGAADGEVVVPPTLQALLAARLDQLDTAERNVLQRGAVEGETFHRGAVQALAPDETQVTPRLAALVRKELIRPDRSQLAGEDGFRFRHLLIRDAAYEALPKATRIELHRRFADWLEERGRDLVELDEILGYHLEQACSYRRELGLPDDAPLGWRAHTRLVAAGRKALLRGDYAGATNLLERAAAVSADRLDVVLEDDVVHALFVAGRIEEAGQRAARAAERFAAAGDANAERCFRIEEAFMRVYSGIEGAVASLEALAQEAVPRFETAGDDLGLCIAHNALGHVAHARLQVDTAAAAFEKALAHARRLGQHHRERHLKAWIAGMRLYGAAPVADVIARLEEDPQGLVDPIVRSFLALGRAMAGQIEEGRAELTAVLDTLAERGMTLYRAQRQALGSVELEMLAGNPEAAVELGTEGCRLLEELGERGWLSTASAELAHALYAIDRLDEAQALARRSRELGASDDLATQALWRQVEAKVLARRGHAGEAEQLAREAVAIADPTQELDLRARSHVDLATVLDLVGRPAAAHAPLEQALDLYERKGNIVGAQRVRARLAELQATAPR